MQLRSQLGSLVSEPYIYKPIIKVCKYYLLWLSRVDELSTDSEPLNLKGVVLETSRLLRITCHSIDLSIKI